VQKTIYVSATPADYELEIAQENIIEQIVRPTGLIDPEIEVKPATYQVDDLYEEIVKRVNRQERVLVTTLTKRMAEDLTDYYSDLNIKVRYMHSDVKTMERIEIIRDLRMGAYDVLIGINLLREGLDIPEVSLVAVLDADKEGFLRSERSLVQTCGRAARNVNGRVILYADRITDSMKYAMDETLRRREIQKRFNDKHGITPQTIKKEILSSFGNMYVFDADQVVAAVADTKVDYNSLDSLPDIIVNLEKEMKQAAKDLAFEKAAKLRDKIKELKKISLM